MIQRLILISWAALCLLGLICAQTPSTRVRRKHDYKMAIKSPYYYNRTIPYYDASGDVFKGQDFIRLAPSIPGLKGALWGQLPNPYPEWEAEFAFRITPRHANGGDGIAFWYTRERMQEGPIFGSGPKWTGLGIFFDSGAKSKDQAEERNPVIRAAMNNGVQAFSSEEIPARELASCFRELRAPKSVVYARITYHANQTLQVATDLINKGESYIPCFEAENVQLPADYYFGISALAGKPADDHDLISLEIYQLNPPEKTMHPSRPFEEVKKQKGQEFKGVSMEEKQRIEKVQENVRGLKRNEEEWNKLGGEVLNQLLESQLRIIESLNMLHRRLDTLGVSSSGESSPDLSIIMNSVHELNMKLDNLRTLREEVKQIGSKVDGFDNRANAQLRNLHSGLAEAAQHLSRGIGAWSMLGYGLVFFIMQAGLVFAYMQYRRRLELSEKKFI
ncbi:uncharacterized protein VTP21DRAFT_10964 [Calcarisporiella thermophila]|uniref:uncharacterized protein n=1 Tax=Calcarisporiella thermophila TaxID=911321 RepID=UPI0037428200